MGIIQNIVLGLTLFLSFGNACIMLAAFKAFLLRPKETTLQRIAQLEFEVKEIKDSLNDGNDKFRFQGETLEVLIQAVQALIEFEIQYCLMEDKSMSKGLEKAKEDLNHYLSKFRG